MKHQNNKEAFGTSVRSVFEFGKEKAKKQDVAWNILDTKASLIVGFASLLIAIVDTLPVYVVIPFGISIAFGIATIFPRHFSLSPSLKNAKKILIDEGVDEEKAMRKFIDTWIKDIKKNMRIRRIKAWCFRISLISLSASLLLLIIIRIF